MATKKRTASTKVEDRPISVEGPVYAARIPGVPMVFHGETKMQALRKARDFAQEHGPKARRELRGGSDQSKETADE